MRVPVPSRASDGSQNATNQEIQMVSAEGINLGLDLSVTSTSIK